MSTLIGLQGMKRSGKDSFARALIGEGFTRFAFADPMKEAALVLDPLIRVEQDETGLLPTLPLTLPRLSWIVDEVGWETAKELREVRRTLQQYGESVRSIEPEFWVTATMEPAEAMLSEGWNVVITDARFTNELQAIRDAGGILVRIERDGLPDADRHRSENEWRSFGADFVVDNNGTLEDLAIAARRILADIA